MDVPNQNNQNAAEDRRSFIKKGMKRAALLAYVTPVIETLYLSKAEAQQGNQNTGDVSPIGGPPPFLSPPKISRISPSQGKAGDSYEISITGSNFQRGADVDFDSGITVLSVQYHDNDKLTANIEIDFAAFDGKRDVTVTNPDGQEDIKDNGFSVQKPDPPTIRSVDPESGEQNSTLTVTIEGTDFMEGFYADFESGITVLDTRFIESTIVSINIMIQNNAYTGYRDITITNPDRQSDTKKRAFEVISDTKGDGKK